MPTPRILQILLLIISTLFATNTLAQRDDAMSDSLFEISGQIRAGNNKVIENAMVRIESSTGVLIDQGAADSLGRFRFTGLRPGQYRVSAASAGLVSQPQVVDLSRTSPRVHVLLQLVQEPPTFASRAITGVIDARVPTEAKAALEKGRAALSEKKTDAAISYFEKAAKIFPDYYDAYMLLGQLHMETSNWPKAEISFRQAVRINPKAVVAFVSLGEAYRREKKYAEGQKVLEEALKLDNNSWESNFTLGRIHWELKDIATAGRYVARSLELDPNVAEAHLLAGNIFVRAGMPGNALIEYQEYLRLAPNGEFSSQIQTLVDKLKKSLPSK